jgi:hypothetical protein
MAGAEPPLQVLSQLQTLVANLAADGTVRPATLFVLHLTSL